MTRGFQKSRPSPDFLNRGKHDAEVKVKQPEVTICSNYVLEYLSHDTKIGFLLLFRTLGHHRNVQYDDR